MTGRYGFWMLVTAAGLGLAAVPARAQSGPVAPSAEAGRIHVAPDRYFPAAPAQDIAVPAPEAGGVSAPEEAKAITLRLDGVTVEGARAYDAGQLRDTYREFEGRVVTLDVLWVIADRITAQYRRDGYFLSRAYVPAQDLDEHAHVTIRVVEGYIGAVRYDDAFGTGRVYKAYEKELLAQKPLRLGALESFLLRVNDVPGVAVRAVLAPAPDLPQGAVMLNLLPQDVAGQGVMAVNNGGSRYIGPWQAITGYRTSFTPGQETQFFLSSSLPPEELQYGSLTHTIIVAPRVRLELNAALVHSEPGYTLDPNDVESRSAEGGVRMLYDVRRQRQESLTLFAGLDAQNTRTDLLDTRFTEDRLRTATLGFDYGAYRWGGQNSANMTLTRGLDILGASDKGDALLSRAQGDPTFWSLRGEIERQDVFGSMFVLTSRLAGQYAHSALLSAAEFGYGGYDYGRAFDPSEITGDRGVAASWQVDYTGMPDWRHVRTTPYAFYDIGKVWNEDDGQGPESGASAGLGVNLYHDAGIAAGAELAFPLTRSVATPYPGNNGANPRLNLHFTYNF